MLKNLSKICIWFIVRAFIFFVLVWILLCINPTDTYNRIYQRAIALKNGTFSFSQSLSHTARNMGKVADYHLKEAAERIDGKDPYQDYNSTLDRNIRQDFNQ